MGQPGRSRENLASCVSDSIVLGFATPKLALDESGRAYLVTATNGELWYADTASGSWSDPVQVTHGANIVDSVGTALRTFDGIAASNGAVYLSTCITSTQRPMTCCSSRLPRVARGARPFRCRRGIRRTVRSSAYLSLPMPAAWSHIFALTPAIAIRRVASRGTSHFFSPALPGR